MKTVNYFALVIFIITFLSSCNKDENKIDYNNLKISIFPKSVNLNKGDSSVFIIRTNDSSKVNIDWQLIGTGTLSESGLYIAPDNIDEDYIEIKIISKVTGHYQITDTAKIFVFNDKIKTFQNTYNSNNIGITYPVGIQISIIETSDGKYIFSSGTLIWAVPIKFYVIDNNGSNLEIIDDFTTGSIMDMISADNNNFVAIGFKIIDNSPKTLFLLRNKQGNNIGAIDNGDGMYTSICKADNGFLITGVVIIDNNSSPYYRLFIERVDNMGNSQWKKWFGYVHYNSPIIREISSNHYVCLYTDVFDVNMMFINENGDSLDTKKVYQTTIAGSYGYKLRMQNDQLIIGMKEINLDSYTGGYNNLIIKTDIEGNIISKKFYGNENYDYWSYFKLNGDKIIMYAKTENKFISTAIDNAGQELYSFSNLLNGYTYGIVETSDNGLVIITKIEESLVVAKTDKYGNIRK